MDILKLAIAAFELLAIPVVWFLWKNAILQKRQTKHRSVGRLALLFLLCASFPSMMRVERDWFGWEIWVVYSAFALTCAAWIVQGFVYPQSTRCFECLHYFRDSDLHFCKYDCAGSRCAACASTHWESVHKQTSDRVLKRVL